MKPVFSRKNGWSDQERFTKRSWFTRRRFVVLIVLGALFMFGLCMADLADRQQRAHAAAVRRNVHRTHATAGARRSVIRVKRPRTKARPAAPKEITKKPRVSSHQPLMLEFKIVGDDDNPSYTVACAGGSFRFERDKGAEGRSQVILVEGFADLRTKGRIHVSFDFKVQHNNDDQDAEETIAVKGSTVLKLGGQAKLAKIGDEGSLVLKVTKAK